MACSLDLVGLAAAAKETPINITAGASLVLVFGQQTRQPWCIQRIVTQHDDFSQKCSWFGNGTRWNPKTVSEFVLGLLEPLSWVWACQLPKSVGCRLLNDVQWHPQ